MSQFSIKYRPKSFDEMVVGNPQVLTKLNAMSETAQAILISGPSGCGKTTAGYIINNLINGSEQSLLEKNCSEERGIEAIRELQTRLEYSPVNNKTVVLLDEVHSLSPAAASALLKIMEKPPHSKVCFILCTDQPYKLLTPMVNRCRQAAIEPPSDVELGKYLFRFLRRLKVIKENNVPIDELKSIAIKVSRAANCIPRMAMQLLEDCVDLISQGSDIEEIEAVIQKEDEINLDKMTGSVLLMLYSLSQGKADLNEGVQFLMENMPNDALGLLMRLQSANYYGSRMLYGGKFDWRGKVFISAMKAKKMKPSYSELITVSDYLNKLRETLREPATDPVILVGTGLSNLAKIMSKP